MKNGVLCGLCGSCVAVTGKFAFDWGFHKALRENICENIQDSVECVTILAYFFAIVFLGSMLLLNSAMITFMAKAL